MAVKPLTAEDAGKRVRIRARGGRALQPGWVWPSERAYTGTLVWDATTPDHPIGLQTIKGSTQKADLWFKAGTEGEVLE